MPDPAWIKDINYNILKDGRHWSEQPWTSTELIHPQWRRNLSDNLLMNLFGNGADKTTFIQFYGDDINTPANPKVKISKVLTDFRARMDTIPVDGGPRKWYLDQAERTMLSDKKMRKAKTIMDSAIKIASSGGIEDYTMSKLYLDTFYDEEPTPKAQLNALLDELKWFQDTLRWICIPFLKYKRESNDIVGIRRPTENEYKDHLYGAASATLPNGASIPIIGLGDKTYKEFLFYQPANQDLADQYRNARKFATEWGFLDNEHVDDRVARENRISKALDEGREPSPADQMTSLGNSNGYKCVMIDGVRTCVPGAPPDYCVNNGATYCPQP